MASELLASPMSSIDSGSTSEPGGGAKTWEELKAVVKDTRKLAGSLASRVPASFTFRTVQTSDGPITRLYFLGIPPKHRESTLLYVNVPSGPMNMTPTLQSCPLLESFNSSMSGQQMSREEQLLRERKRLGIFGITSYEMTDKGHVVFPACNSLFTCVDDNLTSDESIFPHNIDSSLSGARMDPQMCPSNSDLVAFINMNDLWVVNTKTRQEVRLTHSNEGTGSLQQDCVSAGVPSFVVQEEFDRYTGYWWEPQGQQQARGEGPGGGVYRILYEEVDESEVEILQIYSPLEEKGVDEYRYPRPGKANAASALKMAEFTVDNSGQISEKPVIKCLYEPLSTLLPNMEYLVRAGWTPDGKYVHCQVLNRKQTSLSLVLIPLECFVSSSVVEEDMESSMTRIFPPVHILYEDTSEIWVNVHDILYFFQEDSANEISFLWLSEKSEFRHLYRVSSKLAQNVTPANNSSVLQCEDISCVPVTTGEWEVSPKEIWVDEERKLVYFIGLKDTVLETQLYVVSYTNPGEPIRLTESGYSHSVAFNKECSLFVSVYSSVDTPPMSTLYQIQHTEGTVKTPSLGVLMPSAPCPDYIAPENFQYKSKSGYTMYGMYYRPHNQQPGVKYPTVLFVYGGPHVQLVSNSFKGLKFLRLHTLASQGYAVVTIDNRGSSCRGLKFESHIKNRMGTTEKEDQVESLQWLMSNIDFIDENRIAVYQRFYLTWHKVPGEGTTEIEDQVEGLQWLMTNVDFIDENRIAIHGWSYGGYLSLMGLAQRPDIFKVAIAGAPVVDWNYYDTGYTERYMDTPANNTFGYRHGGVLHYIDNFTDKENRLLIVHGLIDENVHFQHTAVLVNALVRACKPHQLQVYPNERHGIRNHEANEHYKTMVLSFLQKNL